MTSSEIYWPSLEDYWWSAAAALGFTALYLVEKRWVLKPLGEHYFKLDGSRSVAKFCDAWWKLQNWLPLFVLGVSISSSHKWWFNGPELWVNFPNPMTFWIRAYYLIELGWYGHAQLTLMVLEDETGKKRSDFWPMTLHHITTILLVSFSYFQGYSPIGCMIMWVHDVVDIFLESALLTKELGWQRMCDALFACFAISWAVFRLYIFPFHLVLSIETDMMTSCPRRPGHTGTLQYLHQIMLTEGDADHTTCTQKEFFFVLLLILVVLHVYWFYLIAIMVKRFVFDKTVVGDIRDDKVDGRGDSYVAGDGKGSSSKDKGKGSKKTN